MIPRNVQIVAGFLLACFLAWLMIKWLIFGFPD
jgi:hypothetical protein